MFEILKSLGKYPEASEALNIEVRLDMTSGGRFLAMGHVMPEGPGARRGVRLSNLETSSSSMGVVRKCWGFRRVSCIRLCGSVLCKLRFMFSVMLLMCVTLGS